MSKKRQFVLFGNIILNTSQIKSVWSGKDGDNYKIRVYFIGQPDTWTYVYDSDEDMKNGLDELMNAIGGIYS